MPNYNYFKGASEYNHSDIRFFGQNRTSGKILNIKKLDHYFLLAYFPGFDILDREQAFSNENKEGFWERMREKYPTRIAVVDSQGNLINDFAPDGLWPTTMIVRNGELWMMGKPNGDVELDYFQIFRVGLKIDNANLP